MGVALPVEGLPLLPGDGRFTIWAGQPVRFKP